MFLKKRDHARIMARLRARGGAKTEEDSGFSEEEEGELRIVEVEEASTVPAQAHFTIKFDEKNNPILSKVCFLLDEQ